MLKKMVLAGLVPFAVLIVGITAVALSLPKQHSFARSMTVAQPPEAVWQTLTDFAGQPAWRKDVAKVERLAEGAAERWMTTTTHGSSDFLQVLEAQPPRRLVCEFQDRKGRPYIRWEYTLKADGAGTRLTLRESGDYGNPYTRFMVRFVLGRTTFVDDCLRHLAAKFGEPANIE
jgi:uncharacterized protein YndB with AHSA1/START domain